MTIGNGSGVCENGREAQYSYREDGRMAGGDERRRIDWHNHTRAWSDGALSVAEVAARGADLGLRIGVADHAISDNWRLRTEEQLLAYIADLERYPVLRGIEISLGEPREPDDRWLARLTHVI